LLSIRKGDLQLNADHLKKSDQIQQLGGRYFASLLLGKPGIVFSFFNKYDRFGRAISLTGTAFDADIDIDMSLGFTFGDCTALATNNTGSA